MRGSQKLLFAFAACAAVGWVHAPTARADIVLTYERLYGSDEAAPGTGLFFRGFDAPVINSEGQIAFYGLFGTVGQTTNLDAGVWADSSGDFALGARTGVTAPGTSDLLIGFLGTTRVAIGGDGNIVFGGGLDPTTAPASADRAIWHGTPEAISLLVREGDDVGGVNFNDPPFNGSQPVFNNNLGTFTIGAGGQGSFTSAMLNDIDNATNEFSTFIQSGENVVPLFIAGTEVPGEALGVLYQGTTTAPPAPHVNATGTAAFQGSLKGADTGAAVFAGPAGDVRVVAAVGRAAPGMDAGVNFDSVRRPDLNDSAQVVFIAGLSEFGNADPLVGDAIYFGTGGVTPAITPVAKFGDLVATLADLTYENFPIGLGPTTNNLGQIAFIATVAGPGVVTGTDTVIMAGQAGDPDDLQIIGREGVELAADFMLIAGPLINDQGLVAFGISSPTDGSELWLGDLNNSLVRVIGTGDDSSVVGLDPGLTVTALKLGTTAEGFRFLSDEGTLSFGLVFDDGSEGIFTATLIPEPTAGALLALGALALLRRRRR